MVKKIIFVHAIVKKKHEKKRRKRTISKFVEACRIMQKFVEVVRIKQNCEEYCGTKQNVVEEKRNILQPSTIFDTIRKILTKNNEVKKHLEISIFRKKMLYITKYYKMSKIMFYITQNNSIYNYN